MATIGKITLASNGTAAIEYAEGKGKLDKETKNWLRDQGVDDDLVESLNDRAVAKSGQNINPDYAASQMKATRDGLRMRGKEAVRVIQSFPISDFNPANPVDWERCNQLGLELAQKAFPDYQVAVFTHIDGEGHKLHNHLVVNMLNITTGKKYSRHRDWDIIKDISNDISKEHGLSVINELDFAERRTMGERKLADKGLYVWKDDLRSRITKAVEKINPSAFSLEFPIHELNQNLQPYGVDARLRGKTLSYSFVDTDGKKRVSRDKRLGSAFGISGLTDLALKHNQALEIEQKPAPEIPVVKQDVEIQQNPEQDIFAQMADIDNLGANIEAKLQQSINKEIGQHATKKQHAQQIKQSEDQAITDQPAAAVSRDDETNNQSDPKKSTELSDSNVQQHDTANSDRGRRGLSNADHSQPSNSNSHHAVKQSDMDRRPTASKQNSRQPNNSTISGLQESQQSTQSVGTRQSSLSRIIAFLRRRSEAISRSIKLRLQRARQRRQLLEQARKQSSVQPADDEIRLADRITRDYSNSFDRLNESAQGRQFNLGAGPDSRRQLEQLHSKLSDQIKLEQNKTHTQGLDPSVLKTVQSPTKQREQEMSFKRRNKIQNQEQER